MEIIIPIRQGVIKILNTLTNYFLSVQKENHLPVQRSS